MKTYLTTAEFFGDKLIKFQKFGVGIGIRAERESYLKAAAAELEKIFPGNLETVEEKDIAYHFVIKPKSGKPDELELYRNDERVVQAVSREVFFSFLESQVRVTIAEFAAEKVFLHAGVVAWKGEAIILPAQSFSGKSALVAELVKKGAEYYSDEYAVLDAAAEVEPFPKWLSLRGVIDPWTQFDCPVESIGGKAGTRKIPVGMILLARFEENRRVPKKWRPRRLSPGEGAMEILPHALPIRNNPKFVLEVLNKLLNRAIIVKTVRGEAGEFAETLLGYFESQREKYT